MALRIFPRFFFAFLLIGLFAGVFLIPKKVNFSPKSFAQAETSHVTLTLFPSSGSFLVGEEVTLSILLENIQGRIIDGVDVKLRFDPKKVLVTEVVPNDQVFMAFPVKRIDIEKGIIMVSALAFWDRSLVGGEAPTEIARLRLLPLTPGEAGLSFDFTPGLTTDTNVAEHQTNLDVLEKAESGKYQIGK